MNFNGALVIDDKIDLVNQLSEPENDSDKAEYKSLRELQNYFLFNNIPLYSLPGIKDSPADSVSRINSMPNIDLIILDLDLNSNGDVDEYDISLIKRILVDTKRRFGKYYLIIYSSLVSKWEEIKNEILIEDLNLKEIVTDENVQLIEKNNENQHELLLESINAEVAIKNIEKTNIIIDSEIETSRNWQKEWGLIFIYSISLLIMIYQKFKENHTSLFIFALISFILVLLKIIITEEEKINKLNNLKR